MLDSLCMDDYELSDHTRKKTHLGGPPIRIPIGPATQRDIQLSHNQRYPLTLPEVKEKMHIVDMERRSRYLMVQRHRR